MAFLEYDYNIHDIDMDQKQSRQNTTSTSTTCKQPSTVLASKSGTFPIFVCETTSLTGLFFFLLLLFSKSNKV